VERFYLHALNATWTQFLAWLVTALLLLNGVFALGYRALGVDAIGGTDELAIQDPFLRMLVFSVGVFTRAGTGPMHAVGDTANWLVIAEAFFGVVFLIVAAGLIIARLTRPRMVLEFSESAIVAPYEGGRALMFRMVNSRPGELSDVRARVMLVLFETVNGVRERDFKVLELERDSVELFNLHWTVVHPINAKSPLKGFTPDKLREAEAEIIISVNAHEDTFSTRVRQRTSYLWDEVRWDVKFASIFTSASDGVIAIDVERLSRTEPVEEGMTSRPSAIETGAAIKMG
jgi:inward rectifier potassium channel